jgi:hexulose-6-phosphate isomerase
MQGRLLPPEDGLFQAFPNRGWEQEFPNAAAAGLDAIEWIYDVHGEDVNPLVNDAGVAHMRDLGTEHGIAVVSVCADWFMERPLAKGEPDERTESRDRLDWLIGRCEAAGIERIVLPFVDASRMEGEAERREVQDALSAAAPAAEAAGVELHLETDLPPAEFAAFIAPLPAVVRVNYDSGNSAALGYACAEELAAYGERIGSFHVKDRVRGGGTVPLGEGDADLPAVFAGLRALGYDGDVVLQVARPERGDEVAWARANRATVESAWEAAR